jgi:hypothetical protein
VTDINFTLTADGDVDDLPRTLRREREARQREAREREDKARAATLTHDFGASDRAAEVPAYAAAVPATVVRFDVPFTHLMGFFIKAVFAAVPAVILLGVLLWYAGYALKSLYPELIHTEVLIRIPR